MAKPRWLNGTIGTRGLFLLWASMVLLQGVAVPAAALGADPAPPVAGSAAAQTDRIPPEIAVNTKELKKSCEADYKKLCPDVRMGGGRIVRCLKEHDADLSAPCRQVVAPAASK
ncbi:MAG: cysteine rich repeat-containing protein [Nitrospirota bacterium]|nr:cysteine rich repeat-containing protein [Nitrospirota bacterium]MDE3244338.1 cysteine rich repeat-containing protein [Nitrospirota bacterium]